MQPTSEKRRDVAAKLRGLRCFEVEGKKFFIWCDVYDALGIDGRITCSKTSVETIADLIDPTCRNKQIDYNRTAPREFRTDNFICSACGETFCADGDGVNHPIDWAYCPNCGARVTGVDA